MTDVKAPSGFAMVRALGGVGAVCALIIVFTYQTTLPIIAAKKEVYLQNAVYKVIPGAVSSRTLGMRDGELFVPAEGEHPDMAVHAGYNDRGELVGVALPASGQGFQDVIKLLYGYDPESQTIIGFQVLESKETPGLGDKIEKDPQFLKNFQALDVRLADNGALLNPIELVKPGSKTHSWQIDAISGATISSKAISKMIGEHAAMQLPIIQNNQHLIREKQP